MTLPMTSGSVLKVQLTLVGKENAEHEPEVHEKAQKEHLRPQPKSSECTFSTHVTIYEVRALFPAGLQLEWVDPHPSIESAAH